MDLLVGCGSNKARKLNPGGKTEWNKLVTLDIMESHNPDVVWDLTKRPLPFESDTFHEIHAYDVLEHLGQQGDYKAFFEEWSEWWRLLKNGGVVAGVSPKWDSLWAWGDPGPTRVISHASFVYLDQTSYTEQVGVTALTDYRSLYKADFRPIEISPINEHQFLYILQAVKPSRITT